MLAAAVHGLSAGVQAFIYLAAVALFVLGAAAAWPRSRPKPFPAWMFVFVALGLALCAFVLFWDTLAVA